MLTIFTGTSYDFIGKRRWAYALSLAVMVVGLASMLVKGGLRYDIDFTGGGLVELRMRQPVHIDEIRSPAACWARARCPSSSVPDGGL